MDPNVPAPASPPTLRVTMLLADSAQVADRKLYLLGGGLYYFRRSPAIFIYN